MKRYKLFAVDLDGTLLDRQGQPHPADVEALRRLEAAGVAVSIVTGRLYAGSLVAVRALGLRGPIACADGSHIVDAQSGDELSHHSIPMAALGSLRKVFRAQHVAGFVLARSRIAHDARGLPFTRYVRVWSEHLDHHHEPIAEHHGWEGEVTGLVGVGPQEHVQHVAREALAAQVQAAAFPIHLPGVFENDGGAWGLVIRAAGPSKGTAIEWLAAHHGCSPAETVVVGDWHNDIPMFRVAGRSFVMAQAPDSVKAEATDRLEASSLTGGGIAEAARKAGLLP